MLLVNEVLYIYQSLKTEYYSCRYISSLSGILSRVRINTFAVIRKEDPKNWASSNVDLVFKHTHQYQITHGVRQISLYLHGYNFCLAGHVHR